MNLEPVVYIGDRPSVCKEWNARRYTFKHGQAVRVPDEFAEVLVATLQFLPADDFGRSLEQVHPGGGSILCRRWGALGDLIMFRAAASAFLRERPAFAFSLRCQQRFVHLFDHDRVFKRVYAIGGGGGVDRADFAGVVSMDQVAEADHRGVHRHRTQLFLDAMSDETIIVTAEDWDIPTGDRAREWVARFLQKRGLSRGQRQRPLVAIQAQGSGPMKSLPPKVMRRLIARLAESASVIIIEYDERTAQSYVGDHDDVWAMCGRDSLHSIELMRHVDLVIAMDSAPLWMAHSANAPVLAILGPTRPEQRISFHPGYAEGRARAVCLNDLIQCEPCFEAAGACKGSYACMREQPDWGRAIEAIHLEAESTISRRPHDVPLPVL